MRIILNLPYTILGLLLALFSLPKNIKINRKPLVFILNVRRLWWEFGYLKNMRAFAFGNTVVLGPKIKEGDLRHEIIHVKQFIKYPFIFPFLYYKELILKGYKKNKYEKEASGNKP